MATKPRSALVIGHQWPDPKATAAGVRMVQLLKSLKTAGYQVCFAAAAARPETYTVLSQLEIPTVSISLNSNSFDGQLLKLSPDLVLFDRFLTEEQYGWRVAEHCPNALRILDTEDVHSLRKIREEKQRKNEEPKMADWLAADLTKREMASILRSDLSLIISESEMHWLQTGPKIPLTQLCYLPFYLDCGALPASPAYESRTDFIFVGNGKHSPNIDAIVQLKHKHWPKIRAKLPKTALHIHGAHLPQRILEMHEEKSGFLVKGHVDHIGTVLKEARVMLAPLRFGAGLKGKLLDAMIYSCPSITTPIGAEGMHGEQPWNGSIAADGKAFVEAAIQVYTDQHRWERARVNGTQLLRSRYDREQWEPLFIRRINTLFSNLKLHREQHFMGQLLQHQSLQATKYLSKYITEKNKTNPDAI